MGRRVLGFSLVEILASVGVVLVLVSLTFPVLIEVKESAQSKVCASRILVALKASALYESDFDDTFVLPSSNANVGGGSPDDLLWTGMMEPYAPGLSAVCPLARQPVTWSISPGSHAASFSGLTWGVQDRSQLSIGMNLLLAASNGYQCKIAVARNADRAPCEVLYNVSQIEDLTRMSVFGDSVPVVSSQPGGGYVLSPLRPWNSAFGIGLRHRSDFLNLGFADGHVELAHASVVTSKKLWNGKNGNGECVNFNARGVQWDPSAMTRTFENQCRSASVWN